MLQNPDVSRSKPLLFRAGYLISRPAKGTDASIEHMLSVEGTGRAHLRWSLLLSDRNRDLTNGRRERRKAEERQWEADLDAYMNAPPPKPCTLPSVFVQNEANRARPAAVQVSPEPSSPVAPAAAEGSRAPESRSDRSRQV